MIKWLKIEVFRLRIFPPDHLKNRLFAFEPWIAVWQIVQFRYRTFAWLWKLGAFGAAGVQRVLEIVQTELVQAAATAGRRTLKDIDRSAVKVNFV